MKVSIFSASVPFARQSKIKKLVEGCILIRLIDIDTDVYVHFTTICYVDRTRLIQHDRCRVFIKWARVVSKHTSVSMRDYDFILDIFFVLQEIDILTSIPIVNHYFR